MFRAILCAVIISAPALAGEAAQSAVGGPRDPALTPGAVTAAGVAEICTPGYATRTRAVDRATRVAVFAAYGLRPSREYELDHLIPLELGGSNAAANLWPQPWAGLGWNARAKDRIENLLHREVCAGRISLAAAQRTITTEP